MFVATAVPELQEYVLLLPEQRVAARLPTTGVALRLLPEAILMIITDVLIIVIRLVLTTTVVLPVLRQAILPAAARVQAAILPVVAAVEVLPVLLPVPVAAAVAQAEEDNEVKYLSLNEMNYEKEINDNSFGCARRNRCECTDYI